MKKKLVAMIVIAAFYAFFALYAFSTCRAAEARFSEEALEEAVNHVATVEGIKGTSGKKLGLAKAFDGQIVEFYFGDLPIRQGDLVFSTDPNFQGWFEGLLTVAYGSKENEADDLRFGAIRVRRVWNSLDEFDEYINKKSRKY